MDIAAPTAPSTRFITVAPRNVAGWLAAFSSIDLPVLASTNLALEEFRANEDAVDAHLLAEALTPDPLMTIKLLAHVATLRRPQHAGDAESVMAALMLLGISPFFRAFGPQECAETRLASMPAALEGFRCVLARSHRAAHFALAFAVQRMDCDATVIQQAALLHDFAELLLWLVAPTLALDIAAAQAADSTLRSATIQKRVLNAQLSEIGLGLMQRWRLPRLLVEIADDHREAFSAQARTVSLAVRLARHTAGGWENAALPDDLHDVARLLRMGEEPTLALLRDIDLR